MREHQTPTASPPHKGEGKLGERSIWILTGGRVGDLKQMQELASALGGPVAVKRLVFRPPNVPFLANLLMDRRKSARLEPSWPDLVLCAEGRTSVIARLIRQRSHGAVKTVCLGRPAGTPADFDLVLTTTQYRLPKMPQVVELDLPIVPPTSPIPSSESSHLGRPVIAVLAGGTSLPDRLDEAAATFLANDLMAYARKTGGTLVVSTSPRTDKAAAAVLARLIRPPHEVRPWRGEGDNPYRGLLAIADEIVVTSDSVSMAADAIATGKPASVYRLPQRRSHWQRIIEALYERTWTRPVPSPWMAPVKWLFDRGIIELRADRQKLFEKLASEGRIAWFGEGKSRASSSRSVHGDLERAVTAVHQLFSPPGAVAGNRDQR